MDFKNKSELELIEYIIKLSNAYYNDGKRLVTDDKFDEIRDYFVETFPKSYYVKEVGVLVNSSSPFIDMEHDIHMGSQNKITFAEGFPKFKKWKTDNKIIELIGEYKYDGISINLKYVDGVLTNAITRGNGVKGKDIYTVIKNAKNIILDLETDFTGSIHAEVILNLSDLEELRKINKLIGGKYITNARNGVAGICNRLDECGSHLLTLKCYDVLDKTTEFDTEKEKLEFIEGLGYDTYFKVLTTEEEVKQFYEDIEKERDNLDFLIDGIVLKTNSIEQYNSLGVTNNRPKGQIAWKYENKEDTTKLVDVVWQVGASSVITPVAIFEPVEIDGSTVRRSTIHNISLFEDLHLYKNAEVIISKRNDVIPHIEEVIEPDDDVEYIDVITKCPSCGSDLKDHFDDDGIRNFISCTSKDCGDQRIREISKYIKKLDIKDVGPAFVTKAFNAGLLSDCSDLYDLTVDSIITLDGYKEKSATKIINSIESKKEVALENFMAGLNISGFSTSIAKLLMKVGFDTLEKITDIEYDELIRIKGIKDKTANKILYGLKERKDLIDTLIDKGINLTNESDVETIDVVEKEDSLTFCFTGKIESLDENGKRYTRKLLQQLVVESGNKFIDKVNKEVDYLVVADPNSTSTKVVKAKKDGVNVISEEEFFEKIGV